jgi:hypothetical protein
MPKTNVIDSPAEMQTPTRSGAYYSDGKGSPGIYDRTPGMDKRTPSPNALPEKNFDTCSPLSKY